jgi:hypothetical protein
VLPRFIEQSDNVFRYLRKIDSFHRSYISP